LIILLQIETNFSISKQNEPDYLKKTFIWNRSEAVLGKNIFFEAKRSCLIEKTFLLKQIEPIS